MHRYFIFVALIAGLSSARALAQASDPLCKSAGEGKPEICVRFDNDENTPEELTDVDFDVSTDPDNPSVTLRHGSHQWRVWCWDDDSNQEPQNIGTIQNLTSAKNWDYDIKILQPDGDPGAADLKHLDLGEDEIGSTHWSKVESGEITGDLPSNSTFKLHRYDSTGGYANFTIGDDVGSGTVIELGRGEGFTVEGSVGGVAAYVTIDIDYGIQGGNFTIAEDARKVIITLPGGATNAVISNGALQIGGSPSETFLYIHEMGAYGGINLGHLETTLQEELQEPFIEIESDLPATGWIDAHNLTMAGAITFDDGEDRTDILGTITLGAYNGDIQADDLSGSIEILHDFGNSGSLDLTGSMSGTLEVNSNNGGSNGKLLADISIAGDLTSDGEITVYLGSDGAFGSAGSLLIGGDLAGDVFIGGDFAGIVTVDDDFTNGADFTVGTEVTPKDMVDGATFTVASNSRGDFWVTGDVEDGAVLTLNKLGANGDVLVDGDFFGDISITEETNATSLIQLGKLMSGALIVINAGEDDVSDANGQIFIGNPAAFCSSGGPCFLDDVEYDGVINILNGTSGGGDFTGVITVQGCHDDEVAMELCICGTDSGTKNIEQTDCENEVPGFACSSSPCN